MRISDWSSDVCSSDLPTIAFEGDDRYVFVEALARQGLLEWASLDTGSLNLSRFSDIATGKIGSIYINDERWMKRGLDLATAFGFHPSFAGYEPGFVRLGAARQDGDRVVRQPRYRMKFYTGK